MSVSIDALLGRPAPETVRLRALELLESAREARQKLDDGGPGKVHDFRVAIRRLRSLLGANEKVLGRKLRRLRRELGDAAAALGPVRDTDVELEWLKQGRKGLKPAARKALAALAARLEEQKDREHDGARRDAGKRFDALLPKLRRQLSSYRVEISPPGTGEPPSYGAQLAGALVGLAADLGEAVGRFVGPTDEEAAHEARKLAKQLRYAVEPLAGLVRVGQQASAVVADLRTVQTELGELHDMHVLAGVAAEHLGKGAERDQVLAVVHARRDELFQSVDGGRSRVDALVPRVAALAAAVTPSAATAPHVGPPLEIERKYLLTGMPSVEGADWVDIEQGYLPGERLVERLRRIRSPDGKTRLIRGMKLGSGVSRIEVEEEIAPELFRKMWPLTAGKRIRKRRFKRDEGGLTWEIDRFKDRDLVLAEVELPSESTPVTLPDWLRDLVVREVTAEPAFTNAALAEGS